MSSSLGKWIDVNGLAVNVYLPTRQKKKNSHDFRGENILLVLNLSYQLRHWTQSGEEMCTSWSGENHLSSWSHWVLMDFPSLWNLWYEKFREKKRELPLRCPEASGRKKGLGKDDFETVEHPSYAHLRIGYMHGKRLREVEVESMSHSNF